MAHPDIFSIAFGCEQARQAAERLFEEVKRELVRLLPVSAEVMHIGATAIVGCLTKGDLDVVVRVDCNDFPAAEARLAAVFARNEGSMRNEEFAAFEDTTRTPHLGIQLTAKGGRFDIFHTFVVALRADPELVRRYNALKLAHHGQPMDRYRAAKDAFVVEVLRSAGARFDDRAAD